MIRILKNTFIKANWKKRSICAVGLVLTFFVTVVIAIASISPYYIVVNVRTDRPNALYKCGEKATFLISLREAVGGSVKEGEISVRLTLDGLKKIEEKKIKVGEKPMSVTGILTEPGFLRCEVKYLKDEKTYRGYAAAGFDPECIKAMTIMPEDFDEFWAEGRAELAKIPLDVRLTPLPKYSDEGHNCFKISFANVDNTRIYGYLNVPTKRTEMIPEPKIPGSPLVLQKKLYPALVEVPGAGVGAPREPIISNSMLTLYMGVHDHDLGLPQEEYEKLEKGRLKGHYYLGAPDRNRYYFRRAILGVDRAINYIASRPEFNGKQLVISGSSQGGFFALYMAGLNQHVTAAAANVPGFADQAAYLAGRMPGSPQLVLRAPEEARDQWLKMSAYFDTVNFARNIKCPVIVFVGFIDKACPPSSVYSAYNEIKAPKRIFNGPLTGHGTTNQFSLFKDKWIEGQLGLRDPIPPSREK